MAATAFTPGAARSISRRQGLGTIELGLENFSRQFQTGEPFEPFNIRHDTLSEIIDEAREVLGPDAVRTQHPRDPYMTPIEGGRELTPREEEEVLTLAERVNEVSDKHNLPSTADQLDKLVRQSIRENRRERELASARSTGLGKLAGFGGAMARETTNPIILASMLVGAGPVSAGLRTLPQLARVARTEAIIGGVSEVPVQAIRQTEMQRLGIGESAGEVAANVGMAAAGGAFFGPVFAWAGALARRLARKARSGSRLTPAERAQGNTSTIIDRQGNIRFPFAVKSQRTIREFLERVRRITEALKTGSLRRARVPEDPTSAPRTDVELDLETRLREALRAVGQDEGVDIDSVVDEAQRLRAEVNRGAVTEDQLRQELATEIMQNPRSRRAAEAADELVSRSPEQAAESIRRAARVSELREELAEARQALAEGRQLPGRTPERIEQDITNEVAEELGTPRQGIVTATRGEPVTQARQTAEAVQQATQRAINGQSRILPLVDALDAAGKDPRTIEGEELQQFLRGVSATRQQEVLEARDTPGIGTGRSSPAETQQAFVPMGDAPTDPEMEELASAFARELEDAPEDFTFTEVDAQGNARTMTAREELQRTQEEENTILEFERCAGVTADVSG